MKTIKNTIQKAFFALTFVFALNSNAQSVAINADGSTADASAILDLKSTNQGVLVPRLTQSQRTTISAPATGLMVYQTDATAGFYFYNGTAWTSLSAAGATGATGAQGIQGLTGTTGATGNAGTNGTIGATGLTGLTGNAGTNGAIGAAGLDGATGSTGIAGTNGTIGATGLTGLTGTAGTNGTNGTNGQGLLTGGTANQVLAKIDGTNYNTAWVTPATGGSDNLGNHTATTTLNMSNNNISNINGISTGSIVVKRLSLTLTGTSFTSADFPSNINDYTYIKISGPTTAFTIHGLPAGVDGKILYIYNNTSNNLNYPAGSATETVPVNRIQSTTSSTNPVSIGLSCNTLIYDSTAAGGVGAWLSLVYQL
jgi:hypothetical protein